jgi:hypothetical protein
MELVALVRRSVTEDWEDWGRDDGAGATEALADEVEDAVVERYWQSGGTAGRTMVAFLGGGRLRPGERL